MRCDGFLDRIRASIVKVRRGSADTPQGRGAEVADAGNTVFDAEAVFWRDVVEQQVGIGAEAITV